MEDLSIINWELHQKVISKHNRIYKSFNFNQSKNILEEEYLNNNKRPFTIQNVDVVSDKGIIILESYLGDRKKYYVDIKTYLLYSDEDINKNSLIKEDSVVYWVIKSFIEYLLKEEEKIKGYKEIVKEIVKSNINE